MDRIPKDLCEIHSLGLRTREWLVGARQIPSFPHTRTIVAGYSEARAGYRFVRHDPAFSQVLACTDGEGRVLVGGRWERCPTGHVYVTAPHALCAYHVRPGRPWRVCWVLYEEALRMPGLEAGSVPRLVRADATGLSLAIQGLCGETASGGESGLIELWAAVVHREAMRLLQPGGESLLGRLWAEVHRDPGGVWTLRRMATCAGMSKESLRRLCLRQTGRPPLAYLTRLRMNTAADLLGHTREKVAAVAARVGYGDAFAFSTAFKREMGVSPQRFRTEGGRPPT